MVKLMDPELLQQAAITYSYVFLWIGLSAGVILFNKYLLSDYGFPYPVALTMIHMGFCSIVAALVVRVFKWIPSNNMEVEVYMRSVVPIGFLYAVVLWLGNTAYLYLSVSFIQMLKALSPVSVFLVGSLAGTEIFTVATLSNMIVVTVGVLIASYGEINFVIIGVVVQLASILCESTRLTLVQILLQRKGLKLNPFTTMYYISPACFAFLAIPFAIFEYEQMKQDSSLKFDLGLFTLNACMALALNLAVFLLIGKTSALSMNVAGVVKDWLLIGLSVWLFSAPVSSLSLEGYLLAFLGVCYYNYSKIKNAAGVKVDPKDAPSKDVLLEEGRPKL
mmetsp:Transcript_34154/g.57390  ORF Transcript_34154/g.57390 Transcript_34154/m.57390 type:complete len:334 (-) Transcript_34154:142-1143(-)|eukprot:CAMPEP_0198213654 /NCGR_PEP_ID=MMETSP1445-20131203/28992_1 /TAXON_ID=36898 /ORGANISM="Pyramimonas sp., Strain CCMP2087" /LENGTH=333 /DNA_ID=CAMNT_0043888331 /DNA_START=220 /DNA_END=1221 /DNA_ORIENTATION=+